MNAKEEYEQECKSLLEILDISLKEGKYNFIRGVAKGIVVAIKATAAGENIYESKELIQIISAAAELDSNALGRLPD